jgi:hypothetical protein
MKFLFRVGLYAWLIVHTAGAMDVPREPHEQFDLFYSGNTNIDEQIVSAINDAPVGSTIILAQLFLTHKKITDALGDFLDKKRGKVELLIDQRHGATRGITDWLEKKGAKLQRAKGLHAKQCIVAPRGLLQPISLFAAEQAEPEEPVEESCVDADVDLVIRAPGGQGKVFFMSENLSTMANQHLEYALYSQDQQVVCDNIAAFQEGAEFMQLDTPEKERVLQKRSVEQKTPAKPGAILTTAKSDILECTRLRMLKPLENGMRETLRIATMTFDSQEITDALKQKAQNPHVRVQLIVDGSVLQAKKGRDLLAALKENGVEIFVYNVDRKQKVWQGSSIPMLQHAKIVYRLREKPGQEPEVLSIFYTGNLAEKSNTEFNMASFHLNDQPLAAKAVALLDQLVKESEPYAQIDFEAVEGRARGKKDKDKEKRAAKKLLEKRDEKEELVQSAVAKKSRSKKKTISK